MNKFLVVLIVCLVIGGCMGAKAASNDYIATVEEASTSGWIGDDETHVWTLTSTVTTADADVYVVNVDADVTGYIGANMKVRLEDGGTVKYFGILSVGAYSGGVTPVYLFGGTDYVLSGAITEFSYSSMRSPFGWPMNEDKWAIEYSDSAVQFAGVLTNNAWVNINSASVRLPAGLWNLGYEDIAEILTNAAVSTVTLSTSLSTTNNTSIVKWEKSHRIDVSTTLLRISFSDSHMVEVSSEETYYLNTYYYIVGSTANYLSSGGDISPTIIRAVWGGL